MTEMTIAKNSHYETEATQGEQKASEVRGPFQFMKIVLTQIRPEDYTTRGPKN